MNVERPSNNEKYQPDLHLSDDDDGKHFTIGPKKIIQISIWENPSTGYRWERADKNTDYIEVIDDQFSVPAVNFTIGGGGIREFFIKTLKVGETSIAFKNKRSWMPDDDDMGYFRTSFTIE
jgi:predicted secreted protein